METFIERLQFSQRFKGTFFVYNYSHLFAGINEKSNQHDIILFYEVLRKIFQLKIFTIASNVPQCLLVR